MLPIVLSSSALKVGVIGKGDGLERRLSLLTDSAIQPAHVFDDRIPGAEELRGIHLLFVAGLDEQLSSAVAKLAQAQGSLVNVEDQPALCDFHVPASVRRGDLLLTASTGGRSPGLSRLVREALERRFGPEWEAHLEELARERSAWRGEGIGPAAVSERTRNYVAAKGWLS
jgi:precorrin-2 dehydrogenase/sirohydrochlorin ferrochelatase